MPFESKSQQRFMFAKHPEMAKEWADKTPNISALPEHVKKMAEGGTTAGNPSDLDAGMQDATASDFLLPYLLSPTSMTEGLGSKLADEAGEVTLGRAAPKMEEAAEAASPKVEAFVKGIQKSPNGNEVKLWGVRGDPEEIAKIGYGSDPATIPEHVLRAKGILPATVDATVQNAPNSYADGGIVDEAKKVKSDADAADAIDPVIPPPITSTDTPKGMAKGGFPHVTFMEDQTPEGVKETTHLAKSREEPKLAKGGTVHKAEDRNKEPTKPKDVEMSHEKKLNAIYKAMGIKGYDGGGVAISDGNAPTTPTPQPGDPGYTSFLQNLLSQVGDAGSAAGGALKNALGLNAGTPPVSPQVPNPNLTSALQTGILSGANAAVALMSPAMPSAVPTSAISTGAPSPIADPHQDFINDFNKGPAIPPPSAPLAGSAPIAPTTPATSGGPSTSGMPNIGTIFNQDTSKLTAGSNPEDRQALVNKLHSNQEGIGGIIAQAVAGLGDAFAAKGGKEQHALGNIFAMNTEQRKEALANFDQQRQDRVQKLQLQTQMGDNALKQAAAADAYGVDEHLNSIIGAPKGTMKKDLPTYFSMMSAQIAAKEKDEDLYMKAHTQASTDVDNAVKNSSVLDIKPSPAQLQASGAKLADTYYNRAKGNILVKPSDGGGAQWIPAQNLGKAKQMDPNLTVQQ